MLDDLPIRIPGVYGSVRLTQDTSVALIAEDREDDDIVAERLIDRFRDIAKRGL